eukprot:1194922-Prorocentrum_minimum.AAC.5
MAESARNLLVSRWQHETELCQFEKTWSQEASSSGRNNTFQAPGVPEWHGIQARSAPPFSARASPSLAQGCIPRTFRGRVPAAHSLRPPKCTRTLPDR